MPTLTSRLRLLFNSLFLVHPGRFRRGSGCSSSPWLPAPTALAARRIRPGAAAGPRSEGCRVFNQAIWLHALHHVQSCSCGAPGQPPPTPDSRPRGAHTAQRGTPPPLHPHPPDPCCSGCTDAPRPPPPRPPHCPRFLPTSPRQPAVLRQQGVRSARAGRASVAGERGQPVRAAAERGPAVTGAGATGPADRATGRATGPARRDHGAIAAAPSSPRRRPPPPSSDPPGSPLRPLPWPGRPPRLRAGLAAGGAKITKPDFSRESPDFSREFLEKNPG
jgi:hypothetical protein